MLFEYAIVFLLSAVLVWVVKENARIFGLVDVPNDRSNHDRILPRGGGIGFLLAVFAVWPFSHYGMLLEYRWTWIAVLLVFMIGILDDHRDASAYTKFFVIIVSTFLLSLDGILIHDIGTYFGHTVTLGWAALPFTIFAVSGFTNAMNLIDGLDGLSSSISIVILGAFVILGYQYGDMFIVSLGSLLIVTLLAFLFFNWHPASVFMGDSGSLSLGFIISIIAIKSLSYISPVSILFLAAVPILDTVIVMIRRKRAGVSVFSSDHCHIHHILRGFFSKSTPVTVMVLGMIQFVYALIGVVFAQSMDETLLLLFFIVNIIVWYIILNRMIAVQGKRCG